MNVCILGMGYIGLPTAAVLVARGHSVRGVEVNDNAREIINTGKSHIIEPDLDMLVMNGVESGRLFVSDVPAAADVFIICVPTPVGGESGADLSHVREATQAICPFLERGNLVVLESTCPPGTTEMIATLVESQTVFNSGEIHFAHAPERVLPGRILYEVVHNDRIIGGIDDVSAEIAKDFYSTFVVGNLISCSSRMAEMAKLTENASRDVQIAFANELSILCDSLELDVRELIKIANRHPRVNILQPGCGVGGHCIAVDPWFLIHISKGKARLMRTAREVNQSKPTWLVEKIVDEATRLNNPVIACLGATYKPDIDDLRESPALEIITELLDTGKGKVLVVEPNIRELQNCELVSQEQALAEADIVAVLVAHTPFRKIDWDKLDGKIVIDACGITYRSSLDF